ncbi:MAG: helix-turn-helix domain-containing protein [Chitinivibrionales bacterium]
MHKKLYISKWIFLILPVVVLAILMPFHLKKDLVFFPGKIDMTLTSYVDQAEATDSGATEITAFKVDSHYIDIKYKIGNKNLYPFAGFQWISKTGQAFKDISVYDHLTISFSPATSEEIVILILQVFTEGFSSLEDRMTWRYLSKELALEEGKYTYTIPLREFQTPVWWYNQYKITEKDLGKPDLTRLGMLSVEEGSDEVGVEKRMSVSELRFQKKNGIFKAGYLTLMLLIYYLLFGLVLLISRLVVNFNTPVAIPYEKLPVAENLNDDERVVFEYLGNHFSNQSLSLSMMSDATGIPGNRISQVIKSKYDLSFRQYLNTIRIAEAKRLLQETKMQVSQIAYRVGYTNLTHFCRTFKSVVSVSPNTFRQELMECCGKLLPEHV